MESKKLDCYIRTSLYYKKFKKNHTYVCIYKTNNISPGRQSKSDIPDTH